MPLVCQSACSVPTFPTSNKGIKDGLSKADQWGNIWVALWQCPVVYGGCVPRGSLREVLGIAMAAAEGTARQVSSVVGCGAGHIHSEADVDGDGDGDSEEEVEGDSDGAVAQTSRGRAAECQSSNTSPTQSGKHSGEELQCKAMVSRWRKPKQIKP